MREMSKGIKCISSDLMTTKNTIEGAAVAVLLVVAGLFAWQYFFLRQNTNSTFSTETYRDTSQELFNSNPFFVHAADLQKSGNVIAAKEQYVKALALEKDSAKKGKIEFELARIADQENDYPEAIRLYKDVAANDANTDGVRAYAIENMAKLLELPASETIRPLIFSSEPYSSMAQGVTNGEAELRLYEYALSFQPMAHSGYMLARWYANELFRDDGAFSTRAEDLQAAKDNLALGDEALARMRTHESEAAAVPEALLDRAIVIGKLALAGDRPMLEADKAYAEALIPTEYAGPNDGYAEYAYALFLADAGSDRLPDIHRVLATYRTTAYMHAPILEFFRTARNPGSLDKKYMAWLASLDQDFKQQLLSLGWTEDDFAL